MLTHENALGHVAEVGTHNIQDDDTVNRYVRLVVIFDANPKQHLYDILKRPINDHR